jgi:hypothetical protein
MHLTIDLANGESTLYCPTSLHDPDHVLWCGKSPSINVRSWSRARGVSRKVRFHFRCL